MKFYVTGGAGFIGSHLVDELVKIGDVVVVDNLSLGRKEFIQRHIDSGKVKFHEIDLVDLDKVKETMKGCDVVFHMAANSDIIEGTKSTKVDFDNGTLATYNVLEAMRLNGAKELVFASTSAIYGEPTVSKVEENYGPLLPISLYGASKLACEGLISAFSDNFGIKSWIFRFANIVGSRGTHGAIFDFIHKLKKNNSELEVLGDGTQEKSYLHVLDCVNGMIYGWQNSGDKRQNPGR